MAAGRPLARAVRRRASIAVARVGCERQQVGQHLMQPVPIDAHPGTGSIAGPKGAAVS